MLERTCWPPLVLFGLFALFPALPGSSATNTASGPRLHAPVHTHDFGTVQQGDVVLHDFVIRNTGDQPLDIADVRPSCGCTTAGDWPRRLAPGDAGSIPIKLETAQFTGAVTKTVTITSNDSANPHTVFEIKGAIWTPVQISNPVVIFPALTDPNQVETRSVKIQHLVEGPLQLTELRSDQPAFKPHLKEIVPGREFELHVTTVPPLATGTHAARITMKSSNPKMPELSVQAVVTVLPPVQVAPSEIKFAVETLSAPEKRYVVVLNHRGGDLTVTDLETNAGQIEVATQLNPGARQYTITLTFPAGFNARAADQLYFRGKTNHPDLPTFVVPIVYAGSP